MFSMFMDMYSVHILHERRVKASSISVFSLVLTPPGLLTISESNPLFLVVSLTLRSCISVFIAKPRFSGDTLLLLI